MTRKTLTLTLTAALLSLGSHALAQDTPQTEATRAQQHQKWGQNRAERRAQHQAQTHEKLHEKLQLRPDQQAAWTQFSQAMQAARAPGHPPMHDPAMKTLSTPERIAQMQAQRATRQQAMDQRLQAVQAFYDQLDAEQKTVFDESAHPQRRGKHGKRGGHGRHMTHPAAAAQQG